MTYLLLATCLKLFNLQFNIVINWNFGKPILIWIEILVIGFRNICLRVGPRKVSLFQPFYLLYDEVVGVDSVNGQRKLKLMSKNVCFTWNSSVVTGTLSREWWECRVGIDPRPTCARYKPYDSLTKMVSWARQIWYRFLLRRTARIAKIVYRYLERIGGYSSDMTYSRAVKG